MNTAARIVTRLHKRDHITPTLRALHWLSIEQRINYKILLFVYRSIHNSAPLYLSNLIHRQQNQRNLRSSSHLKLLVPKTHNSYGDRAFSVIGPKLWNSLPTHLTTTDNYNTFKKDLKTYLFAEELKN